MQDCISCSSIHGRVRAHIAGQDSPELWVPATEWKDNLIVYQWATIAAKLLSSGDAKYRIGGMYLEFENVASPGDTVTAPSFDRTRDVTYYDSLSSSSNRDYIRVPIIATQITSEGTGLTDNKLTFFGRSSGTSGVHGKAFSSTANSTIFGASLVAYVDNTDATQDLILSSFYFSSADQQQKLSTSQIGIEWNLTLQ